MAELESKKKALKAPVRSGWIWLDGCRKEIDCHLLFRKEFVCRNSPKEPLLRIAASDQYRLFINGRLIGDGPARSEKPTAYVDTYRASELRLRTGVNCIAVLAHNTMMPQHGQALVPGGLKVELEYRNSNGRRFRVQSDGSWRVLKASQFQKPAPRRFFAVGFNEKIEFSVQKNGWELAGYDARGWQKAVCVDDRPYRNTIDRPIPLFKFENWKPAKIRGSGRLGPLDGIWGLPFDKCRLNSIKKEGLFATYIYSARKTRANLSFGCDNWARVLLNGQQIFEKGRPDAKFRNHLEYNIMGYKGMLHGNGHRWESWSATPQGGFYLKRGWNRLVVWLFEPAEAYGFEGAFFPVGQEMLGLSERLPVICSAVKESTRPDTWVFLPREDAPIEQGAPVEISVPDARPRLEASHLFDWDIQKRSAKIPAGARSLLDKPKSKGPMILLPGEFIEFQLPKEGVGFIEVELRGPGGALVDVTITEAQTKLKNGRMRSLYNGLWQTDRLVLSGGKDRWLSLDRRAGRFLAITIRQAGGPVEVFKLAMLTQHYPAGRLGQFKCSDRVFTRMWEAGAATVAAATFDVAEDCPTREKAQWNGDTYLRMFQMAYLYGDLRLSAKGAREFAFDQKPDRWSRPMVPSGYGDKLVEYCFIIAPWYWHHYRFTGDIELLRETFRGVRNLLSYTASLADSRGFALPGADIRNLLYIDYTMIPVRKRLGDTIGVMQGLYVMALDAAAKLAELLNERDLAVEWRYRAVKVREQAGKLFWSEKKGLFADSFQDGRAGKTFSGPTNYWMLLAGIPAPGQEQRILKWLWPAPEKENMAAWARGESPYTKYFASEALLARGMWKEAFTLWRGFYGSLFKHPETDTVPEWWDRGYSLKAPLSRSSLVHPFGIGPMAHLASHVAGIRPLEPGYKILLWEPMPGDLKWFKAELPLAGTGHWVKVTMEPRKGGGRQLLLRTPRNLKVRASSAYLLKGDRLIVKEQK